MIPPEYMALGRRWFFVIFGLGFLGAVLTYGLAVATGFGQGGSYSAGVTLGVSRVLSYGGSVETAGPTGAGSDATENAAFALTDWAKGPQFLSRAQKELQEEGYYLQQLDIYNRITISSDRSPGLIVITASSGDEAEAAAMVKAAAAVLQEKATADEDYIRTRIETNFDRLGNDLQSRLSSIYTNMAQKARGPNESALRVAMLNFIARGTANSSTEEFANILRDLAAATSDTSLVVMQAQAAAIEAELAEVSADRARLEADLGRWEEPLIVVSPQETVESQALSGLRKRDLVVMGGLAGLVVGWAVANVLERLWPRRREEVPEQPAPPTPEPAYGPAQPGGDSDYGQRLGMQV